MERPCYGPLLLLITVLLFNIQIAHCRIFDFEFHHDTRQSVIVNTFGHTARGVLNLTVTHFELHIPKKIVDNQNSQELVGISSKNSWNSTPIPNNNIGFIYKRITSDESAQHESYFRGLFIHSQNEKTCFENLRSSIRALDVESIIIPVSPTRLNVPIMVRVPNGKKGLYGLFYYNCEQKKELVVVPISMHIHVEQYNEVLRDSTTEDLEQGRDYLTVGESPLSIIYITLSGCFLLLTLAGGFYTIKE